MKMSDYWFASGTPTLLFESLKRFNTQIYDIDGVETSASVFNQPTESITSAIRFKRALASNHLDQALDILKGEQRRQNRRIDVPW